MKINILLLIIFLCSRCYAQRDSCYQASWTKSIAKKVPTSICTKKEKIMYQLFSEFDFDQDGLSDVAIKVGNKVKVNVNGDTIVLKIFRQQPDSTFTEFVLLDNVFPMYFEKYALDYEIQDEQLLRIKNRYQETYPLERLEIDDEYIHIHMIADATAVFHFIYTYSTSKKDWLLSKLLVDDEESEGSVIYDTFRIGTSINESNYFDYIEGDF